MPGREVVVQRGRDGCLDGALIDQYIAHPPEEVAWDYLLAIEQTPTWRTHLGTVSWAEEGPVGVGSRIDVTTSLLRQGNASMVCEVTCFRPDAGVFAHRVVDGPATTENEYRVRPEDDGTRFEMQGRVLLDSISIPLTVLMLDLTEDRMARREVKRLKRLLEGDRG